MIENVALSIFDNMVEPNAVLYRCLYKCVLVWQSSSEVVNGRMDPLLPRMPPNVGCAALHAYTQ